MLLEFLQHNLYGKISFFRNLYGYLIPNCINLKKL